MFKSIGQFKYYFSESKKEFFGNSKIYSIYILLFCIISVVQNRLDLYLPKEMWQVRVLSKLLFSGIPILIFSKILYVIKIRMDGTGDYGQVLWRYMIYSGYYFCMVLSLAFLYLLAVTVTTQFTSLETAFLVCLPFLGPLVYVIIFYSLAPIVAVFEEKNLIDVFKSSHSLIQKNISLVLINHLFSLLIPLFFGITLYFISSEWKIGLAFLSAIPESVFSIILLLTTMRIYAYLNEIDD